MRQPVNIHLYLYRKNSNDLFEYAVFRRADDPKCWQGISGGVEENETLQQAAIRECYEEAGIVIDFPLYRLETISFLPSNIFFEHKDWGHDIVVCPMYFFAAHYQGNISISEEHSEMRWCIFKDAYDLIYWHDQKTALWELNERLIRGNLIKI